jgi:hypothetical protein
VRRSLTLVMLGILLGAVSMNIYLAGRLDALYIDRETLRVKLYETTERLKKTEAQWQSHRTVLIREVDIQFVQETPDAFLEIALREVVTKLVQDLVGEELESISPSLAVHLLDRRIVEADGRRYRLYVRTLIVSEKLTYILSYELVTAQTDTDL